jgi:AcrR family transcriptional regulator
MQAREDPMKQSSQHPKARSMARAFPGEGIGHVLKQAERNRHGQVLRVDGQITRTRILVTLLEMLSSRPLPEVTMAAITSALGLNRAIFYRYFSDIGEALLAAYDCVLDDAQVMIGILDEDWSSADDLTQILTFLDTYRSFWRRHGPLLRARDSFASAGDLRFVESRQQLRDMLVAALARRIGQKEHSAELSTATAQVLILATESAASGSTSAEAAGRLNWQHARDALAKIYQIAFTGEIKAHLDS